MARHSVVLITQNVTLYYFYLGLELFKASMVVFLIYNLLRYVRLVRPPRTYRPLGLGKSLQLGYASGDPVLSVPARPHIRWGSRRKHKRRKHHDCRGACTCWTVPDHVGALARRDDLFVDPAKRLLAAMTTSGVGSRSGL